MNLKTITKEELFEILNNSKSMREVILLFNLSPNGSGGYRNIKDRIIKLGLEIPKYNYYGTGPKKVRLDEDVFVENSTFPRQKIKTRILKKQLLEYHCVECGNNGEWNGKNISLHLDHINGVNNDNRIENLRFLCPNCHSQTSTYSGKSNKIKYHCECGGTKDKKSDKCIKCTNKQNRKVERPSIEQIKQDVVNLGYRGTGRKYGVSDNAVRKWLK